MEKPRFFILNPPHWVDVWANPFVIIPIQIPAHRRSIYFVASNLYLRLGEHENFECLNISQRRFTVVDAPI